MTKKFGTIDTCDYFQQYAILLSVNIAKNLGLALKQPDHANVHQKGHMRVLLVNLLERDLLGFPIEANTHTCYM